MPDAPDPPRKFYKFKAAEFESVNDVPRDSPLHEAQPLPDPGIVASDQGRIDVRDLARTAAESLAAPRSCNIPATPTLTTSFAWPAGRRLRCCCSRRSFSAAERARLLA